MFVCLCCKIKSYFKFVLIISCQEMSIQRMSQSSSNSPGRARSSFHLSSQAFLISYLMNEFGYSEHIAQILIQTHNCVTMAEMMDLFLRDQNGLYGHVFIRGESGPCEICGEMADEHRMLSSQMKADSSKASLHEKSEVEGKRISCEICYIEYVESQMVSFNGMSHGVCLGCMNEYLKHEIMTLQVQKMRCPHCGDLLTSEIIQRFVDATTFSKYQSFVRNLQIQKHPNLRWCPNPKCSIVLKTNNQKKTIKCNKCGTEICTKCNREAHPRMSCKAVFKNEIKGWENAQDIQKCRKCKATVQKVSGCNHMSCTVCHYEWCWLCNATYSQAHFSPLNPFGCAGLQDMDHSQWGKCRIMLWRTMMFLLIIILAPIILPLVMIGVGPGLLIALLTDRFHYANCWVKVLLIFISIPIGIAIDPFVWIGFIVYFVPKGVIYLVEDYRRRRDLSQYSEEILRERLLRQSLEID